MSHKREKSQGAYGSFAIRILVVEDDTVLRCLMELDLRDHDVSVAGASDGREAIALLQTQPVDLVFLDVCMPYTDGFAVLLYMRQTKLFVPTVMLTNERTPENDELSRALGARETVMKIEMEDGDLWRLVQKHLPERFPSPAQVLA